MHSKSKFVIKLAIIFLIALALTLIITYSRFDREYMQNYLNSSVTVEVNGINISVQRYMMFKQISTVYHPIFAFNLSGLNKTS